jgi:YHS domain-containing protein
MKTRIHSVAAVCTAVLMSTAASQAALDSDQQIQIPSKIGAADEPIILAQAQTRKNSASSKASNKTKLDVDSSGVILHGYDPVGYFKQKKAVKGNPSLASTYQGATYYFASKADKTEFDKNPSKYVPQYGGFCADSMSKRQKKDSDPTVFTIYKGKLYLCSSPAAMQDFRAHEDEDIVKANRNWLQELKS